MSNQKIQIGSQSLTLIASKKDTASKTIANECEKIGLPIFYLNENQSHLFCTDQDLPQSDNYIVVSRHSSSQGKPAFTVHSVGNFSPGIPKFGGMASKLCPTNAELQTKLLQSLNHEKQNTRHNNFEEFEVVLEATHHGPFLNTPTIYIEMGSSEEVWSNEHSGRVIAKSIKYLVNNFTNISGRTAIAFGGTHYPLKFTNLMLENQFNIGHICPKYSLVHINENLVIQMIQSTVSQNNIDYAIFEKKGMNRKQEIKEFVKNLDLELIQV